MNVSEIMQTPPPEVGPETRVAELAKEILKCGLPGLPIVDNNGKPIGVVSQRDLVAKHAKFHLPIYLGILGFVVPLETHRVEEDLQHILAVKAADLMERHFAQVSPETDVDDASTMMIDAKVDVLLVVENERLIGVVTDADIIRLLILEESDADPSTS